MAEIPLESRGGPYATPGRYSNNNQEYLQNGYISGSEDHRDGRTPGRGKEDQDEEEEGADEYEEVTEYTGAKQERDYYALLQVERSASDSDLRTAYKHLSRYYHPDKHPEHLRNFATARFNLIKLAYETLIDPSKRSIYDLLGEEGLLMKLDVGTRGMSKDELRYYVEEKVRRTKREAIEREVGSHGIVVLGMDGRSWFGLAGDEGGGSRSVVDHVRKVFVQHGFHVSVGLLGKAINTPVSVSRVVGGLKGLLPGIEPTEKTDEELSEESVQEDAIKRHQPPVLRFSATIGGQRVIAKDDTGRELRIANAPLLAQAGMEVSLSHSFPTVPHTNTTPRGRDQGWMYKETSIAKLMANCQITLSHALMARTSTVSCSRPMWGRRFLQFTAQMNHGSRRKSSMPVLEMMLAHQVARKGTFFVSFGTGSKWGLRLPFGVGLWGSPGGPETWWGGASSKIGYTYRGSWRGGNVDVEDEDGEDEEAGGEGGTESSGNANTSSQSNGTKNSSKERSSKSKSKSPPKLYRNPNTVCTFYLAANALTPSTNLLTLGLDFSRTFLASPRPKYLPLTAPLPNSYHGIRATIKSNVNLLGTLSLSLILTRAVATHSRLGISVSVDPDEPGIVLSIVFRRLGQKVQIPIWVAKCMGPVDIVWGFNVWATGATGLVMGWWAWEVCIVRPWEVRQRRINRTKWKKGWREKIEAARKEADEAVQLMWEGVERKRIKERDMEGLVVVEATYGLPEEAGLSVLRRYGRQEKKRRIDVTIPVCNLVESSQLIIPGTISKSQLTGFYDPFPGRQKSLRIKYLFRNTPHEVEVPDGKGVLCPNTGHAVLDLD